ncbi:hypothetical protein SAMN05660649_02523 [Desulfotomaculum arcticum]|uniref:Uncharacterized protein n=1 Tax=Desulfotruncus arcticus DSM 17038 TaxID=1121424 RepID=A0A1I2UA78_9FIRM|nr:hypothetical protein [Desulfotruncus arcticus]SFG72567.1 hypothetical protein SAMN05660649_02523 [Desulfotomaculum arcticum] [Desulfotruncus arcticus DSM 17038]
MKHTTNTRIIFADSLDEAKKQYLSLDIKTEDPNAVLECYKATDEEDFELDSDFNFVGEISVSPEVMETIRQDPERAYVLYYLEG